MPEPDDAVELRARVVVIGAGPAGLAAAAVASAAGLDVLLLDAAPVPGGQIWRARQGVAAEPVARALARLAPAGVRVLAGTRVVMVLPDRTLLIDGPEGARRLRWERLILATGARERLLPFPGWTLPGVFGAGGLQALVKGGWPIRGRRVLVAGTGPLLLAAAATLRREGALVVGLVEEARAAALARFAGTLAAHPGKALQAVRLGGSLLGVPFIRASRVLAAEGDGRVERVVLQGEGGRTCTIACDALAAGWGLIPQTELGQALGCALAPRAGARGRRRAAHQRRGHPRRRRVHRRGRRPRRTAAGRGRGTRGRRRAGSRRPPLGPSLSTGARTRVRRGRRRHVRPPGRLGGAPARRHARLPLRGRALVGAARPARPAQRQARHALRHGPLPGTPVP
jgi:NADPH-dependent 2,4-dienoyl-CoA reductase/sulfur reductase-like enzyme